jgi:hypothetical protein
MLNHEHADRRQLRDLMTTEAASGPTFIGRELVAAPSAHPRVVLDDLIDLILRLSSRPAPRCPSCPPALRLTRSLAKSSFAFARASARRC